MRGDRRRHGVFTPLWRRHSYYFILRFAMSNIFAGSAEFVREAEVKYNDDMRNEI